MQKAPCSGTLVSITRTSILRECSKSALSPGGPYFLSSIFGTITQRLKRPIKAAPAKMASIVF